MGFSDFTSHITDVLDMMNYQKSHNHDVVREKRRTPEAMLNLFPGAVNFIPQPAMLISPNLGADGTSRGVDDMTEGQKRDLAVRALKMAIAFRQPPKGCIHHTDRGSQYCSHDYQKILRQNGFKVSMSGKGNCYDNAAVETFFKTIKAEMIWRRSWQTRRDAELAIFQYINGFYNPRRRHSSLGWKSPVAFERKVA